MLRSHGLGAIVTPASSRPPCYRGRHGLLTNLLYCGTLCRNFRLNKLNWFRNYCCVAWTGHDPQRDRSNATCRPWRGFAALHAVDAWRLIVLRRSTRSTKNRGQRRWLWNTEGGGRSRKLKPGGAQLHYDEIWRLTTKQLDGCKCTHTHMYTGAVEHCTFKLKFVHCFRLYKEYEICLR